MSQPAAASSSASTAEVLNSVQRSALDELSHLSPLYRHNSLSILAKVITAVLTHPSDAKLRRLNADKLKPKIRCNAGFKLLESFGFKHALDEVVKKNKDEAPFMTMVEEPDEKTKAQMKAACEKLNAIIKSTDAPAAAAAASSSSSSSSTPAFKPTLPEEGDIVEDEKFVFFWHPPNCFGQWTSVAFVVDGITYCNAEQYMMAMKAKLMGDHATYAKILTCASARQVKSLGRQVTPFDGALWDRECSRIVYEGNLAKFSQNPAFAKRLLATGNKVIAEASPLDGIWGIGMSVKDPDVRNQSAWKGTNLLGKALMKVRDTLREKQADDGVFE